MTDTIYCDPRRLEQGLQTLQENDSYDELKVLDTDCVLRGITQEEMKERNIRDYGTIVTIEHNVVDSFTFKFHQEMMGVNQEFTFRPPGPHEIDADYCMSPAELGGRVGGVAGKLEESYPNIVWDFAEVSAASFAQPGHMTDFEFEYEFIVSP